MKLIFLNFGFFLTSLVFVKAVTLNTMETGRKIGIEREGGDRELMWL